MNTDLSEIKQLVAANELALALDQLSQLPIATSSQLENGITLLRGRLNKLAEDRINGVLSPADDQLINNQIRTVLLQLITSYEKEGKEVGNSLGQVEPPVRSAKNIVNIKNNYGDINLS